MKKRIILVKEEIDRFLKSELEKNDTPLGVHAICKQLQQVVDGRFNCSEKVILPYAEALLLEAGSAIEKLLPFENWLFNNFVINLYDNFPYLKEEVGRKNEAQTLIAAFLQRKLDKRNPAVKISDVIYCLDLCVKVGSLMKTVQKKKNQPIEALVAA